MQGVIRRSKAFLAGIFIYALALPAFAQNAAAPAEEEWVRDTLIEVASNVVFLAVLGIILLVAGRNKQGWNVPLKWAFFSFKGRMNRKAYWLKGFVPLTMIMILVQVAMTLTMLPIVYFMGERAAIFIITAMVVFMVPLAVFQVWTGLAISFKRLHDRGRSAWFLLFGLIPLVNIWIIIELWFLRGTKGDNKYGPDPLDGNAYAYADDGGPGPAPTSGGKKSFFTKKEKHSTAPREPEDSRTVIERRLGADMFAGGKASDRDEE